MRGSTGISHRHSDRLVPYSSYAGCWCGLQHHERTGTSTAQRVHTKGVPETDATNTQSTHKRPSITIRRQPKTNAPAAALSDRGPGCAPNPGNKHVTSHTAPRPTAAPANAVVQSHSPARTITVVDGAATSNTTWKQPDVNAQPQRHTHTHTHKLWQPPSGHDCTPTSATAAQAAEMCCARLLPETSAPAVPCTHVPHTPTHATNCCSTCPQGCMQQTGMMPMLLA